MYKYFFVILLSFVFTNNALAVPNCGWKLYCYKSGGAAQEIPGFANFNVGSGVSDKACLGDAINKMSQMISINHADISRFRNSACSICSGGTVRLVANMPATNPNSFSQVVASSTVKPAGSVCKCPSSWFANNTNVDGGETYSGPKSCKKFSALSTIQPNPPDGTPIGDWGFSWADGFYAWGTSQNGGASVCTNSACSVNWALSPPPCTGIHC